LVSYLPSWRPWPEIEHRTAADLCAGLGSPGDQLRKPPCLSAVDVHIAVDAAVQPEEPQAGWRGEGEGPVDGGMPCSSRATRWPASGPSAGR
jgi:hypothetical protein